MWALVAQVAPEVGLGGLLATLGVFAPFAAFLLLVVRTLWVENKAKEARIEALTERTALVVAEITRLLAEVPVSLRELTDRVPTREQLSELNHRLRDGGESR